MKAGGISTVRLAVPWSSVQPTEDGGYDWTGTDAAIDIASQAGLRVLPFVYSTPSWLAPKPTTLPIDTARRRASWTTFLQAMVKRYGPGGDFWAEHGPGIPYVTNLRCRTRCRSATGRSGTRPTSSTSPTPSPRRATRGW